MAASVSELTLVCQELERQLLEITADGEALDNTGQLTSAALETVDSLLDQHIQRYSSNKIPVGEFQTGNVTSLLLTHYPQGAVDEL